MSAVKGGSGFLSFLYPCVLNTSSPLPAARRSNNVARAYVNLSRALTTSTCLRKAQSQAEINAARRAAAYEPEPETLPELPSYFKSESRLNPPPTDYSRNVFLDRCTLTVHAGSGGNGCVSFQREAYIPDGPPNGGDGGSGGNVWIQAVAGQTSLHKLARRGLLKAGRGIGGQGKNQGGKRGEDICIQVPPGTVVREIWRSDPVAEEEARFREMAPEQAVLRNKWVMYAGATGKEAGIVAAGIPKPTPPRRSHLTVLESARPIQLDLDTPMDKPVLLAAGAVGGLGNPHFVTKEESKPKFATKGELGVRLKLALELKLLADVGLVGMPNAGKSTLLRSISNSRTRVGDWAFTTLEPSIGTVVLDDHTGRPTIRSGIQGQDPRTSFTVADIPGLVQDAHLDRGLGLGFLRHVERARILAFVVDLSAGDSVKALQGLWREVGEYENLRNVEINQESQSSTSGTIEWSSFADARTSSGDETDKGSMLLYPEPPKPLEPLKMPPISAKPWFVVATKADMQGTEQEYMRLRDYIQEVESGNAVHPSGQKNGWRERIAAIPVSAIRGEGVVRIKEWTAGVLDSLAGAGEPNELVDGGAVRSRIIEAV